MADDTTFDADALLSLPRVSGLTLSPDGRRLVTSVTQLHTDGKKYVSALWELDVKAAGQPRRLTRSAAGESGGVFASDGSLLFLSARPDPDAAEDAPQREGAALWRLPAAGGEPSLVAAPPGGVDAVVTARASDTLVFAANSYPGTPHWDADAERDKERRDKEVTAQLFTEYPIRHWDSYLGPRERHLHAATVTAEDLAPQTTDVVKDPGRGLDQVSFDVTADGRTVVTGLWREGTDPRDRYLDLVAVDAAGGAPRTLAAEDAWFESPKCSPDGRWVVAVRESRATPDRAMTVTLWLIDLESGEGQDLTPTLDLWPVAPVWAPDSSAVFFTADCQGRTPPYRVDVATGTITRLAARGSFTDLCPSPDGETLYGLQSMVTSPPQPVVLDTTSEDQDPHLLTDEWQGPALPGRLERISVPAEDGAQIHSWLLLPPGTDDDNPAPLAVLIHGGPLGSWTGWHWRWSPHVFTARGYAVLLPDPALSTGYGQSFIQRGWGHWSDVVYTDVMAAVDAAVWRPDIDSSRTAALGGSFGGYMANWIAGQTDQFRAIVTHASLWDLTEFHGTTDLGVWWEQEFGDPYLDDARYREHSPHLHVGSITTPMLVIHGEMDYRVPIGQGLKLWTDLRRNGIESRFLYYPDENHWVLKPNNSRLWYATVLAFLDHHVLDQDWVQPDLV